MGAGGLAGVYRVVIRVGEENGEIKGLLGAEEPRGWVAKLVRFMDQLTLHFISFIAIMHSIDAIKHQLNWCISIATRKIGNLLI